MSHAVMISVRVTTRSSRDSIDGVDAQGVLLLRVTAAPVDGAANRAVTKLIATALKVPKSSVRVAGGAAGRSKRIRVEAITDERVRDVWPGVRVGARATP